MAPDSATANIAMLDVRKQQVAAMQRAVSPGAQRMMDYREEHVTPRSPNGSIYARAQSPGRTRLSVIMIPTQLSYTWLYNARTGEGLRQQ